MLKLNHKTLDVWLLAVKFVSLIYKITSTYPKEEGFGLISQTRTASVSRYQQILQKALQGKV
jgi:four helix bundle protein